MSICTQCGGRDVIPVTSTHSYYCSDCKTVDGVLEATLRREAELRQRVAELETALQEIAAIVESTGKTTPYAPIRLRLQDVVQKALGDNQ